MVNEKLRLPIQVIQEESGYWRSHNFPGATASQQLLGAVEEMGELAHAFLKREQGIRGTDEEHAAAIKDAVGDVLVYLMGFCDTQGLQILDCVNDAWDEVKDRDWVKYPGSGRPS